MIVGEHDGPPHKVLQATSGGSSSFASANILGGNPNQGKSRNSRKMDGLFQITRRGVGYLKSIKTYLKINLKVM